MTESEDLFKKFCDSLTIPCERVPKAPPIRTPDFRITLASQVVFVEVKELEDSIRATKAIEECKVGSPATYFPMSPVRIRTKISQADDQLSPLTLEVHPGIFVVYSMTTFGDFHSDDIHAAMFDGDKPAMTNDLGTHISALAHLRRRDDGTPILIFYHNKSAKVPFDPSWLRGETVRHFASEDRSDEMGPGWVPI